MLQDKLGLACQRHTEITGYTIGAQTHTNPTSTNNFAYLTGRNFGLVSKTEATGRNTRPVASVATRTISEFTSLRQEMRATAERVPAGV